MWPKLATRQIGDIKHLIETSAGGADPIRSPSICQAAEYIDKLIGGNGSDAIASPVTVSSVK
jgi:hypothetical protein